MFNKMTLIFLGVLLIAYSVSSFEFHQVNLPWFLFTRSESILLSDSLAMLESYYTGCNRTQNSSRV